MLRLAKGRDQAELFELVLRRKNQGQSFARKHEAASLEFPASRPAAAKREFVFAADAFPPAFKILRP